MKARYYAFLLLLVFHTTKSTKNDMKLEEMIAPMIKQCSKLKCPPVNKPVCAKLLYNQTGLVIHSVLLNKCEKKYVECYPGVQVKLVPMKFCSHDHVNIEGQEISMKGFAHKRAKRELSGAMNASESKENLPMNAEEDTENLPMNAEDDENISMNAEEDTENLQMNAEEDVENHSMIAEEDTENLPMYGSDTDLQLHLEDNYNLKASEYEKQKKKEVFANSLDEIEVFKEEKGPALYATKDDASKKPVIDGNQESGEDEQFSESFNWRQVYPKADMDNYEADCPKTCPIRPVMVCGRCKHGIYTTFLSVCHMRMQYCLFKNDSIELISRSPCMMLAPLLPMTAGQKQKHPSGRVNEPNDDDKVLRYIWCRERNYKGVYCKKNVEDYQILGAKNKDTALLYAGGDPDNPNLPMNAGDDSDNLNPPMNTEEDTDNSNVPMYAGDDTVNTNRPINTEEDTDSSNLPMNSGDGTVNTNRPMNTEEDTDDSNLPMNAGDNTDNPNLRSKSKFKKRVKKNQKH